MIREKDGIHIESDKKYVADSRKTSGEVNFVSHAHFDHLHQQDSEVVCSDTTASLAEARTGKSVNYRDHEKVKMIDSGHIIGSRSAIFNLDQKVLYTGDFSTRDRLYIDGFEPRDADILVIESTYGIPAYRFPDYSEIEREIIDWIQDTDKPLFLFGYSLGKAQKIQKIVEKATDRPILAHGSVRKMNEAVEKTSDLEFSAVPYGENKKKLEDNGILIAPTGFAKKDGLRNFVEKVDGVMAGFSGWASNDSFRFGNSYDRGFPLSDHADFDELVATVKQVDPEKVFATHGFDEAFAKYLADQHGFEARALKQNQRSLSEFS